MIKKSKKIYFNTYHDEGGVVFLSKLKDDAEQRYKVRFAGKPKFIITHLVKKYGQEKGVEIYEDLMRIFLDIGEEGFSPFVLYTYPPNAPQHDPKEKAND